MRSSKAEGFLIIVLHAHLPYVRYPEHENHLEENWLHEAITECYIPLLNVFEDLLNDKIDFRVTLSLTPSLLEMLSDELLMQRYERYLESRIELAEKEISRTKPDPRLQNLALMYHAKLRNIERYFSATCRKRLIPAFRSIYDSGSVELITSAATHAYLPVHISEPAAVRSQIVIGVDCFRYHFGRKPSGIWLPECGYAAGIDEIVSGAGPDYFFLESHGMLSSTPTPKKSIYLPVKTPSGAVVFGRDVESAKQVWSSKDGYPGDFDYRDFYRDIGFDLELDYIGKYMPGGVRSFTGMKYFRITGKTEAKDIYDADSAIKKAAVHAEHFMNQREKQVISLRKRLGIRPVITAAYDAELFGHWWYEGPEWLRFVFRNPSLKKRPFRFMTPAEFCKMPHDLQTVSPGPSSWGQNGYNSVWIDSSNSWTCRHLQKASELMEKLAVENKGAEGILKRYLNQALRELLLAQSSDWPFMMKMKTADRFADTKFREHISNFFSLCADIYLDSLREPFLSDLERKNCIFRNIDFRVYAGKKSGLHK